MTGRFIYYAQIAQEAFVIIRNVSTRREKLDSKTIAMIAELSDALHNLPFKSDIFPEYLTIKNLDKFIETYPEYQGKFQNLLKIVIQESNHQELAEISADWFATIEKKYL